LLVDINSTSVLESGEPLSHRRGGLSLSFLLLSLGALTDDGYSGAVFPRGHGPRQGYWLRDAECAWRCGLDQGDGVEEGSAAAVEASAAAGVRSLDPALA
jgi:hypothetical protein